MDDAGSQILSRPESSEDYEAQDGSYFSRLFVTIPNSWLRWMAG
jgi:hypothetical protein